MSWLTGLAGKAENLLNNIDQAAGQALSTEEEARRAAERKFSAPSHKHDAYSPYLSQPTEPKSSREPPSASASASMSSSVSVPSNLSQMDTDSNNAQMSKSMYSPSSSSSQLNKTNKKDKDDDLFAFLNNSESDTKKKSAVKTVMNGKHSRHSSASSTHSSKSAKHSETALNPSDTVLTMTGMYHGKQIDFPPYLPKISCILYSAGLQLSRICKQEQLA